MFRTRTDACDASSGRVKVSCVAGGESDPRRKMRGQRAASSRQSSERFNTGAKSNKRRSDRLAALAIEELGSTAECAAKRHRYQGGGFRHGDDAADFEVDVRCLPCAVERNANTIDMREIRIANELAKRKIADERRLRVRRVFGECGT